MNPNRHRKKRRSKRARLVGAAALERFPIIRNSPSFDFGYVSGGIVYIDMILAGIPYRDVE